MRYPLLRLLVPLIFGILFGEYVAPMCSFHLYATSMGFLFVLLLLTYHKLPKVFTWATFFLFFLLGSFLIEQQHLSTRYAFSGKEEFCLVHVEDDWEEKERSLLCEVSLQGVLREDSLCSSDHPYRFLLYFPKDSLSYTITRGNQLLVQVKWEAPKNNGNPDEFDYARYLKRKGITGSAYIPANKWKLVGNEPEESLRQKADDIRNQVVEHYRKLHFEEDELAVLMALTLGEKDELSDEIRETYSVAGASHVLALSGLHVALIAGLFMMMLYPLYRWNRHLKHICMVFVIILLILFAYFTGLSPSVVRAVLMFSLLSIAFFYSADALSLNAVWVAAFLMLLIHPLWLFDVGFQLSFSAVIAILTIQPLLRALYTPKTKLGSWLWGLMTVSVAAQLGTAPLVIYYFARFSTHFLLTNLLVIPMITLILYVAVFMLLFTPFPALQQVLAQGVNRLIQWQHVALQNIEQLPCASIDRLWIDGWQVLLIYLLLASFVLLWKRFTPRKLICSLASACLLVAYSFYLQIERQPQRAIAFYNLYRSPGVHLISENGESWMVCVEGVQEAERVNKTMKRHWNYLQMDEPTFQDADSYPEQIIEYAGKRICFLHDNRWKGRDADSILSIDYLYVSKGYRGDLSELKSLFSIHCVVLDASLSDYYTERIVHQCQESGIYYISLAEHGAYKVLL